MSEKIAAALDVLKQAMAEDPGFAWGWHSNLAMPIMDSTGISHRLANKTAATLMRHLFDVDMSKNELYGISQRGGE